MGRSPDSGDRYRLMVMGSMVVVLLLAVLLVTFWPAASGDGDLPFSDTAAEFVQIDEIQPTSHSQELAPPPPAPLPPVVRPVDEIIETQFDASGPLMVDNPGDDARQSDGASQAVAARLPDVGARLLRAVQPQYPSAAKQSGLKARVVVEVAVNDQGRVTEASVVERVRLGEGERPQAVGQLGYGIEQAALRAARRSLFRPAEKGGRPVSTRTQLTFTFGQ